MLERVLFWGLITTTVLAPLPFGSNRPWSWSLLALLTGALVVAWGVGAALRRVPTPFGFRLTWPILLPFAAALAWAVVQALSFVPQDWHHPMWAAAAGILDQEIEGRVTVDPFSGWTGVMRLLSYGAVFWLALQLGRDRTRARQMLIALDAAAGVYAVYGLGVHFSGSQSILWFDKWTYHHVLTSTFVNRNSYATYAGFGLLCAVAMLVYTLTGIAARHGRRNDRLLGQLIGAISGRGAPLLLVVVVLTTALALTASRGGFTAAAVGLVGLGLVSMFARGRSTRAGRRVAFAVSLLVLVAFVVVSGDFLGDRLIKTDLANEQRDEVFATTLRAIDTAPLRGTGLGTFEQIFQTFQPSSVEGKYRQAHNSYLENALELGAPAAAMLILPLLLAAGACAVGVSRRRRDAVYPIIAVGATVLAGVHALVDFSLEIPANALTYALILGLGYGQAWRGDDLIRRRRRALVERPDRAPPAPPA
jgi:O-antigen ligase